MEKATNVRARVAVTIEVRVSDSWGGNCTADQIHEQAIRSVRGRLKAFGNPTDDIVIVGEPIVTAVMVDLK